MQTPEIDLDLLPGWRQAANPDGPLTFTKAAVGEEGNGVLQLSVQDLTLGAAPDAYAAEIGERLGWGKAARSGAGECRYGAYGDATFIGGKFPVQQLWAMTGEGFDGLLVTWIGEGGEVGVEAARIAMSIRPPAGIEAGSLRAAIAGARSNFAEHDGLAPGALLFGQGTFHFFPMQIGNVEARAIFLEAIRHERAKADAVAVALVAEATARVGDQSHDIAILSFETRTHRRKLIMPVVVEGGVRRLGLAEPTESNLFGGLQDFFREADLVKLRAAFPDA